MLPNQVPAEKIVTSNSLVQTHNEIVAAVASHPLNEALQRVEDLTPAPEQVFVQPLLQRRLCKHELCL